MRELRVVPEDADDKTFGDDGSGPPTPPRDKEREERENIGFDLYMRVSICF